MTTRRRRTQKRHNKTCNRKKFLKKRRGGNKKWVTAVDAAQDTLNKTGSLKKARNALRLQAYQNARKLFGSVGEKL
jgi:hypothetical protein